MTNSGISRETEDSSSRPLATFALFAYNQERYVREAIEAAFAQNYSPLEIILSDDGSSDGTFAIMQQMAAAYEGPHSVRARQSAENAGILGHVLSVAREADGELFVVAAGDDISVPERVSTIVEQFDYRSVPAYSSDESPMDAAGHPADCPADAFAHRAELHARTPSWINGATAAYRTEFLANLPMPSEKVLFEDQALVDVMKLRGWESARSTSRLVHYRSHDANVYGSTRDGIGARTYEAKNCKIWSGIALAKAYALETAGDEGASSVRQEIAGEHRYFEAIGGWMESGRGISGRVGLLKSAIGTGNFGLAVARCLPASAFFGLKRAFRAFRSARQK